jgi:threonine dehydrogenase-like Zn-dependent dehydrogenase
VALETDPADVLNELIRCVRKGGCISVVGAYAGVREEQKIGVGAHDLPSHNHDDLYSRLVA